MINKPQFITFTGADEFTSIDGMVELAEDYPCEFGILFSPKRQGEGRYPPMATVERFKQAAFTYGLRMSAHLCGIYSDEVCTTGRIAAWRLPLLEFIEQCQRVQINTSTPPQDMTRVRMWCAAIGVQPIFQCRGAFPLNPDYITWLFDASGGRGREPASWPTPLSDQHSKRVLKGYAGGLGPANVARHLATIASHDQLFYLDMESAVRDERDRFDLAKCRAVCEAVYGRPA